ncbi:MAG: sugar ABC transporter ATP-binding protein [Candidatus Kryptonium sp.]|nr:sugar ABC transporter ATP-binding protein [Candidatus Kryptonium sp.]
MELLTAKGIVKKFPGVVALNGVDFHLNAGEIHALIGENGAGKSTLIKVLSGVCQPDEGEIILAGKRMIFHSPTEAINNGIITVHQELNLFENLTVGENIFVGDYKSPIFSKKQIIKTAQKMIDELEFPLDASKYVKQLSSSEKQLVLIAKALIKKASILILDEPTAAISEHETRRLFSMLKEIQKKNVGVIFISHRLDEIYEIADTVTVLRDGNLIVSGKISEFTKEDIVKHMVGREISDMYPKYNVPTDEVVLKVSELRMRNIVGSVSFNVRKGEIFGITGLVGSGANLIPLALYGSVKAEWENLELLGKKINKISSPRHALNIGLAVVPEDRKLMGLFMNLDVRKNICIQELKGVKKYCFLNWKKVNEEAMYYVKKFSIKAISIKQLVKNLSGGNQQKVVLSKVLRSKPKVIFLVEPTRGIDVGAKVDVYKLINELANQGIGVVLVSTELPEIVKLCDRVLVMHRGCQAGILAGSEISQQNIMKLATGG